MPKTLNLAQKQKLPRKIEPFILKEGIMYKMGQDNRMCRCLTTSKAQIVLKELHERVVGGHFVANIKQRKFRMQDIGGQLFSRILMTFAKAMIVVKRLEDSKQKVCPSW
jgi:hypothetical protein